jgi:hypothetical protein
VLAAEPIERFDLAQVSNHHRVEGEHGIVAASGDRLDQDGQLAVTRATGLADIGIHSRNRPAHVLDQIDHQVTL